MLAVVCGLAGLIAMHRSNVRVRTRHMVATAAACLLCVAFISHLQAHCCARASCGPAISRLAARVRYCGATAPYGVRTAPDRLRSGNVSYGFRTVAIEDLSRLFPDYHHESPHNLAFDARSSLPWGFRGCSCSMSWGALAWRAAAAARRNG